MTRQLTALYTALCLFVGMASLPTAPQLVCRVTGQTMAADGSDCCAIALFPGADGSLTQFALKTPGCCDLQPAAERPEMPGATEPGFSAFALWQPARTTLFTPPALAAAPTAGARDETASRAPPLRTASPRAPPLFS